jgi:hypothetical protein
MWTDTDSDEKGRVGENGAKYDEQVRPDDRAYWRRRFLILCGGVAALGVCAWLFPGAHQPSKHEAATTSASMAALAKRQALPSAASGPAWPGPSSMPNVYPTAGGKSGPAKAGRPAASPKPGVAYHPKTAPSAHDSQGGKDVKGKKDGQRAKDAAKATSGCAPGDIVLSLFTGKPSYAKGAHPSFSVYAVSTKASPCQLTFGAGAVQVVVTRQGHVVWDSNACKPGPAQPVKFTLGVPQALTMVWNPSVKEPSGCAGALPGGAKGTLNAVAVSHGQSSPVRTFKLDG